MVDLNQLAGAFGSVTEDAATVAARNATSQQLGRYGLPQELNPFAPKPTVAPPPVGNTANVAKEDQQQPPGWLERAKAFAMQYQRVLLIGAGVGLVALLVLRRKRRK